MYTTAKRYTRVALVQPSNRAPPRIRPKAFNRTVDAPASSVLYLGNILAVRASGYPCTFDIARIVEPSGLAYNRKRRLPIARPQFQMGDLGQTGADQALHIAVHTGQA